MAHDRNEAQEHRKAKKNPLAYTDSSAEDLVGSAEEFFEHASIEVHCTEVESALPRNLLTMASSLIGKTASSSTLCEALTCSSLAA